MQINRVSITDIKTSRLDPDYYNPEYLASEKAVKEFGSFNLGDAGKLFAGPFGSKLPSKLYLNKGVPLFRISNIGNMEVVPQNMAYLSPEVHQELNTSEVGFGDLLIVKASVSEKICKVPKNITKANITQHIIALRSNGKHDTDYLMAFLFSRFGCHQLLRRSLGSIIQYLGISDARNVSVPDVSDDIQNYIGNKVRQAELLREWANQLERQADKLIEMDFIWEAVPSMTQKPRTIKSKFVNPASLGPEFNRANEGQSLFENSKTLRNFIKSCKCGDPIRSDERMEGRYDYYGASGPIDKHNDFNFNGTYIVVAQDGSIGCASVSEGKIWANNHVWVLTVLENSDTDSIARYLNHHFPYWKGVTTGSVIPKVTSENLLNVKIPDKVATNNQAGDLLRKTKEARLKSTALTEAAKLLVEYLIEGHITEEQLVDVQQELEDGDNSKDRNILNKLTDKGYLAEGGKPLFGDLDKLYELLDEAQNAIDSDSSENAVELV
ncbi:MAG: type I restriction enzyme S subunit [Cocleimonas sp.]|jgi:type I restriction enzyme S subunit